MNETVKIIFGLLGGLAVFIYGMNMMSECLQKAAGEKMKAILAMLTKNPVLGVLAGALVQLVALVVAYLVLGLPEKIIWLVLSTVAAIFAGVVIQFIFMNLDYARTENVQFEDDEYYYYVKAVPKKMIAKEEKVVKHFGNTGSLGKKIPRHNQENISKEAIAKDLEIDENIFEDDK